MFSSSITTSAALTQAANFLIRPLCPIYSSSTTEALQKALLMTLPTVPTWRRNARLTLTISSGAPPRPIHSACSIARVDWVKWFHALGGREFDITVNHTQVTVYIAGSRERIVVWKQECPVQPMFLSTLSGGELQPEVQVPISKLGQSVQSNWTTSYGPIARPQPRTLAQQLLQSEHEDKEANEIFDIISNLNTFLVSPAPTPRPVLATAAPSSYYSPLSTLEEDIFHSRSSFRRVMITEDRAPSPISSPESSRPSSPSSIFSHASSEESCTSVSSTSSATASPVGAAAKLFTTPSKPKTSRSYRNNNRISSPHVIVNPDKKEIQKYLYQGGQTTVLTGGVMLGATTNKTSSRPAAPKYRIPARARKASAF